MAATTYRGAIPLFKDRSLLAGEPTGPLLIGQGAIYLDPTASAPKILVKFKDSNGAMRTGSVTMTVT